MLKRFTLGFLAGYVAGARAGTDHYDRLVDLGERVLDQPTIRDTWDRGRRMVRDRSEDLLSSVRGGSSPRDTDEDDDEDEDEPAPARRSARPRAEGSGASDASDTDRSEQRNRPRSEGRSSSATGSRPRSGDRSRPRPAGHSDGLRKTVTQLAETARARGKVD